MGKTLFLAASAAYAETKHLLGLAYSETKHLVGTVGRRGWRPLLPWVLVFMGVAIAYRIAMGLPLPQVPELMAAVAPFVIPALMGQWTRSIEARAGVANTPVIANPSPTGGLVNNQAIA